MEKQTFRTSGIERWGFALFMAGQAIVNTFMGSFFQLFLTNIGITATLVGILFLVARIWDAINDPIFGAIVDKSSLGSGKFLPWLRAANIMLPLVVLLLFAIPSSLSMGMKFLWAFVAYLLYDVAYTMCDVPIFAMTSAVTDQVHERINIMSRNTVLSTLTIIIVSIVVPQVYPLIGAFYTAVGVAVLTAVLMFFMSRFAKERYINKDTEKVTIGAMVQYVKQNKYLGIGFVGILLLSVTSMTNTVIAYFAIHCLGDMGMVTGLTLFMVLPALVIAALMPQLTKRFDKFHLLMFGIIGHNIMNVIIYFAGYQNLALFNILMLARGFFFGFQMVLQLQFTGDFVEYGEYKTGKRLQGTAYAIQTFVFKFMNALPAAIAMFILAGFGFMEGEGVIQPQSALDAIWILFILSPVVGGLLSLPVFAKYKLRDKSVQIMAAANSGEITRAEAEKLLGSSFKG